MDPVLCDEVEIRLETTYHIKANLQESDDKLRVQILANLLYAFNSSWHLESFPILIGDHPARAFTCGFARPTKKCLTQIRSWLNRAGVGYLIPKRSSLGDSTRFLRVASSLMDSIDQVHGSPKLKSMIRQLLQKHGRVQLKSAFKRPAIDAGNASQTSNTLSSTSNSIAGDTEAAASLTTVPNPDGLKKPCLPPKNVESSNTLVSTALVSGKENEKSKAAVTGILNEKPHVDRHIPSGRQIPRTPQREADNISFPQSALSFAAASKPSFPEKPKYGFSAGRQLPRTPSFAEKPESKSFHRATDNKTRFPWFSPSVGLSDQIPEAAGSVHNSPENVTSSTSASWSIPSGKQLSRTPPIAKPVATECVPLILSDQDERQSSYVVDVELSSQKTPKSNNIKLATNLPDTFFAVDGISPVKSSSVLVNVGKAEPQIQNDCSLKVLDKDKSNEEPAGVMKFSPMGRSFQESFESFIAKDSDRLSALKEQRGGLKEMATREKAGSKVKRGKGKMDTKISSAENSPTLPTKNFECVAEYSGSNSIVSVKKTSKERQTYPDKSKLNSAGPTTNLNEIGGGENMFSDGRKRTLMFSKDHDNSSGINTAEPAVKRFETLSLNATDIDNAGTKVDVSEISAEMKKRGRKKKMPADGHETSSVQGSEVNSCGAMAGKPKRGRKKGVFPKCVESSFVVEESVAVIAQEAFAKTIENVSAMENQAEVDIRILSRRGRVLRGKGLGSEQMFPYETAKTRGMVEGIKPPADGQPLLVIEGDNEKSRATQNDRSDVQRSSINPCTNSELSHSTRRKRGTALAEDGKSGDVSVRKCDETLVSVDDRTASNKRPRGKPRKTHAAAESGKIVALSNTTESNRSTGTFNDELRHGSVLSKTPEGLIKVSMQTRNRQGKEETAETKVVKHCDLPSATKLSNTFKNSSSKETTVRCLAARKIGESVKEIGLGVDGKPVANFDDQLANSYASNCATKKKPGRPKKADFNVAPDEKYDMFNNQPSNASISSHGSIQGRLRNTRARNPLLRCVAEDMNHVVPDEEGRKTNLLKKNSDSDLSDNREASTMLAERKRGNLRITSPSLLPCKVSKNGAVCTVIAYDGMPEASPRTKRKTYIKNLTKTRLVLKSTTNVASDLEKQDPGIAGDILEPEENLEGASTIIDCPVTRISNQKSKDPDERKLVKFAFDEVIATKVHDDLYQTPFSTKASRGVGRGGRKTLRAESKLQWDAKDEIIALANDKVRKEVKSGMKDAFKMSKPKRSLIEKSETVDEIYATPPKRTKVRMKR